MASRLIRLKLRSVLGGGSHENPLDNIPRNAPSPPVIAAESSWGWHARPGIACLRAVHQRLPEVERKGLNRRARVRPGLRTPSRLPDRGRDSGPSR